MCEWCSRGGWEAGGRCPGSWELQDASVAGGGGPCTTSSVVPLLSIHTHFDKMFLQFDTKYTWYDSYNICIGYCIKYIDQGTYVYTGIYTQYIHIDQGLSQYVHIKYYKP